MSKLVTGFFMIIFVQKDLAKAITLYTKLGFELTKYKEGQWAEFKVGDITIGMCPADNEDFNGGYTGAVFTVESIADIYARRDELGLTCITEPFEGGGGTVLACSDASGNRFDLYQEPEMRCCKTTPNTPQKDFDGCCLNQKQVIKNEQGCC